MKMVDLKKESPSVTDLLAMARKKCVLLVSKDGATFMLEGTDDFDREVAALGGSDKFMRFLSKRSKQRPVTSIEQFAESLVQETHNTTLQPPSRARRKSKSQRNPRAARG